MIAQRQNHTDAGSPWDPSRVRVALATARHIASRGGHRLRLSGADREDLRQDILLAIVERTVRFDDGCVTVVAELNKKVDWDQRQLAGLVERIRAGGENPGEYVEVSFKVAERAYAAWPERIRTVFEPARTVRTGRQTFKLSINPEGV